jgi:hypothetical protein
MAENEAAYTWRETKISENGAAAAWRERNENCIHSFFFFFLKKKKNQIKSTVLNYPLDL